MRFIISAASVSSLSSTAFYDFGDLIGAIAPHLSQSDILTMACATDWECTRYANHSVQLINGEWVFEVDDEGLFKAMRSYGRIARVLATFVAPIKALVKMLEEDTRDLKRWCNQLK